MTTFFHTLLPGVVLAFLVLAFSLADDMPAIGRWFWLTAFALMALTAIAAEMSIQVDAATELLIAAGPAGFLLVHSLLRTAFLKWKGEEPVLAGIGSPGDARFFYETDQIRNVTAHDYLYAFLVGLSMLLAASPAAGRLIGQL